MIGILWFIGVFSTANYLAYRFGKTRKWKDSWGDFNIATLITLVVISLMWPIALPVYFAAKLGEQRRD